MYVYQEVAGLRPVLFDLLLAVYILIKREKSYQAHAENEIPWLNWAERLLDQTPASAVLLALAFNSELSK